MLIETIQEMVTVLKKSKDSDLRKQIAGTRHKYSLLSLSINVTQLTFPARRFSNRQKNDRRAT
jgi:hypothetical protein